MNPSAIYCIWLFITSCVISVNFVMNIRRVWSLFNVYICGLIVSFIASNITLSLPMCAERAFYLNMVGNNILCGIIYNEYCF